ncbi:endonuclease/exonuclease/phosphatase family metal-dependent hydrolase [Paenibacillus taihuensis]|uniref:Endonuclease/exonuclease/phosphatase family metal-dependent hydrolase n=1 Tax=Paenibacillus taihuensis TaxID=1156355 RepID=A0A3D9RIG3_9BACL|nr:endonuclease/exonuclease/phosphatase family protein [Paenibacillus taihuensis]REE78902.1 endonuclease/exonuclease/phosphatase family metal-dependent hydrolase [Paenibacillus taihuensis]
MGLKLHIMTFNLRVHVLDDGDNAWPNRIAEAAEAIKHAQADIVCTQEGTPSMLRDLQELLPEYRSLGASRSSGTEDECCAIFYKSDVVTLKESGHFGLSEHPEQLGYMSWDTACPRMCTWAKFSNREGGEWIVYNTHLDHVSEEARQKGIQLILSRMNSARIQLPAMLTGDFNCEPESSVIELINEAGLTSAFSVLDEPLSRTYHAFQGGDTGSPIDYIYVSQNTRLVSCVIDRSLYNGRYPSDHYPITAAVIPN